MNEIERKIRALLEGRDDEEDEEQQHVTPPLASLALNDNRSLARSFGADTLDGSSF